jgi:hypothetical protein
MRAEVNPIRALPRIVECLAGLFLRREGRVVEFSLSLLTDPLTSFESPFPASFDLLAALRNNGRLRCDFFMHHIGEPVRSFAWRFFAHVSIPTSAEERGEVSTSIISHGNFNLPDDFVGIQG